MRQIANGTRKSTSGVFYGSSLDVFSSLSRLGILPHPRENRKGKDEGGVMVPGELLVEDGDIELNPGKPTIAVMVANTGDRPIQVGSHFHFYETNAALQFDREQTRGMRLDIPAGTAVRFEPGDERLVTLVAFAGSREVYGFNARIEGSLDNNPRKEKNKKKK